jgi:hypothetical protein
MPSSEVFGAILWLPCNPCVDPARVVDGSDGEVVLGTAPEDSGQA